MASQRIIVTGASSGIGKAISDALHQRGYHVIGVARNIEEIEEERHHHFRLDVSNSQQVDAFIQRIAQRFGQIHGLVNAAGVGFIGSVEDTSATEVKAVFETNTFGVLNMCRAIIPIMRSQGAGTIINITSIAGRMGLPYRGIYAASKFAVEGFSEAMSQELRPFGIRVVILEPGDFKTAINQHRKVAAQTSSVYQEHQHQVLQQICEEVDRAPEPDLVAHTVIRILEARNPVLRYQVGYWIQRAAILVKSILPSRWFERMVMNRYKMRR